MLSTRGFVANADGRCADAEADLRRATEIRRSVLGDSPATALAEMNCGQVLLEGGQPEAALEMLEASRSTCERIGKPTPEILRDLLERARRAGGGR
jgi:predicted Zn-dependent protease